MTLRVGLIGLGQVSGKILEAFGQVEGVALAGVADIRPAAREAFATRFSLPAYESIDTICAAPDIDAVWIATPNTVHCEAVVAAARAGKHILCEKPMATSLAECDAMIAAAERAGVRLLMVSKILEPPVRAMRRIVDSGRIGEVYQINTIVFTDWLQRPRSGDELKTELGGGMLFRQAPHAVDIQRYVVGKPVKSVRAVTGRRDKNFATEGHFSAMLNFSGGIVGTVSVNGYGFFDGAELTGGVGESGDRRTDETMRKLGKRRSGPVSETEKFAAIDGRPPKAQKPDYAQPHYGLTIVSGELGVLRQSANGILVYDAHGCEEIGLPVESRAATELIEMRDALAQERPTFPDGRWGRDTLAVATAMLKSSREEREIPIEAS